MGAEFNSVRIQEHERDKVLSRFQDIRQECLYEYGHDIYGGHLGCLPDGIEFVIDREFECAHDAADYINENHNKWNKAMACHHPGGWVVGGWCPA